jgi:hypothetical protein
VLGTGFGKFRNLNYYATPTRSPFDPLIPAVTENPDRPISFWGGIIEQDCIVGTLCRDRKIRQAAKVTPSNVWLWYVVSARQNARTDASQVHRYIFCSDVNKHNLESKRRASNIIRK